ncbi:MAG: hypothetical protein GY714_08610 [Desulfobacterales bacterium]|nr:hypothetical protein [Desulfobacterales bacterium]
MVAVQKLTPDFRLFVNGNNVTEKVKTHFYKLIFNDRSGDVSDELMIEFSGDFIRPVYSDILELWLGYKESALWHCGKFHVQTTEKDHLSDRTTLRASSADFSGKLKEVRHYSYENITIKELCSEIASRHSLSLKCDVDISLTHISQTGESDLSFLKRLSHNFNAVFSIKNETLIFLRQGSKEHSVEIKKSDCSYLKIKHANRKLYDSVTTTWQEASANKVSNVTAGNGGDEYLSQRPCQDSSMARERSDSLLKRLTGKTVTGRIRKRASQMFAGSILKLSGAGDDDGRYLVTESTYFLTEDGFNMDISVENTGEEGEA